MGRHRLHPRAQRRDPGRRLGHGPLRRDDVPSGSTTPNIVSQVGASIGTALLSVLLASNGAGAGVARQADAFRDTYWWAAALLALAAIPALLLPARRREAAPPARPHGTR
ncbi:hypothetical protein Misp01_21270 [Microtetraspora sp. NBRC 13810]|uniref:hypothetical protein n=1 Tax=Microtetraspora sp. NBRC 13810 TaxID=3030990 RepID=UPI0024A0046F|nr:hypothetical protein [Microtetraspora sp. NBRC 13810]GLW06997.1 hypothetical protein Misp01_21270 [Microtetraspora sp. NBRC 13810]